MQTTTARVSGGRLLSSRYVELGLRGSEGRADRSARISRVPGAWGETTTGSDGPKPHGPPDLTNAHRLAMPALHLASQPAHSRPSAGRPKKEQQ
jgi:hypothetical protein